MDEPFSESQASTGQHIYANVLKPTAVRESLLSLYGDSVGLSYKQGEMGDSQETFEAILGFLHREYVDPDYLEHSVESSDSKFALDN